MIVKLTLVLSNNTHINIRDSADKEMIEQILQKQYQEAFNCLIGPKEKAIVEKCELTKEV